MKSCREFHAYCIGTSKSGTHSISGLFQPHYKAAHEPENYEFIQLLLATQECSQNQAKLQEILGERDQRLGLALESSNLLSFFAESLATEFPTAKFILTIRDCYSWLDSCLNHQLNAQRSEDVTFWWRYRDFCFKTDPFEYADEESLLAQHQLYTLDGYLAYWQRVNQHILTTIPRERLLIVPTVEIDKNLEKIAEFLAIPPQTLNRAHTHLYKAPQKFALLKQIDHDFLEQKVAFYCQDIMEEFFPTIQNVNDALRAY